MSVRTHGRAARLGVMERLTVAQRAAGVLRQKEVILRREETRLAGHARRTEAEWVGRAVAAGTWALRVAALAGDGGMQRAARGPDARVEVVWMHSMGVRFPGEVSCTFPDPVGMSGTAAAAGAIAAHRRALEAAVRHAAADEALRCVRLERERTSIRRRALEDHLLPRLREELRRIDVALDEGEREDATRARWATRRAGADHGVPS